MAAHKTLHIPSQTEIDSLDVFQKSFNQECAGAIKWIYRIQHWRAKELERRIPGVKSSVWRAYGQTGYEGSRSLHVCAGLSWLTQITMSALYYGNNIENYWQDVDLDVIQCIAYSGLLPGEQFEYLVMQLLTKLEQKGYANRESTLKKMDMLAEYRDTDFLMPEVLDVDAFKDDYYQSIAKALSDFRVENGLSQEVMAYVLGVTEGRYESYETPEKSTTIPLHLAMRLKLGFKIENTVPFTDHMEVFKSFNHARRIQQIRESVIIELMHDVDHSVKQKLTDLAFNVMQFHQF